MGSSPRNADQIFSEFFGFNITAPPSSSGSDEFPRSANKIFSEFFGGDGSGGSMPRKPHSGEFPQNANDVFSEFFGRAKKPAPVESQLLCSLEELYCGLTKKMKISRTVVDPNRQLVTKTEVLSIDLKAGWKKGTKITFENKGNEQPNQLPADLVFVIDEKPHDVYTRDDNDLIIKRKVSLADALAGTTLNLKTLDGRNFPIVITDIVTPGYELVVANEGMPITKTPGTRGNLKIKFEVKFPTRLRPDQRAALRRDLEG